MHNNRLEPLFAKSEPSLFCALSQTPQGPLFRRLFLTRPQLAPKQWVGLLLGTAALLLGWAAPWAALPSPVQNALGIAAFALFFWTTEPIPIGLSSAGVLVLIPAVGLLSFEQSLAPLVSQTVWLVLAGMALSLGVAKTGLGHALAAWLESRLSQRPFFLLCQLHLIGLVTAFLIPSGVIRVLLLMPIGMALVARLRGCPSSWPQLKAAVLLSLLCSTYFGGCGLLTGSVPNLVLAGQYEKLQGVPIFWATWLYWMFPIIGFLRTLVSLGAIWLLFGRHLNGPVIEWAASPPPAPLTRVQRRTLAILLAGVGLWATDLLHHIQPVYVGLGLVVVFVWPRWGPLRFGDLVEVRFALLAYIIALLALGHALDEAGFNHLFIGAFGEYWALAEYGWLGKHLSLCWAALPLNFLMDVAAVAGVATIPLMELGGQHGIAPLPAAFSVAMATTLAFLPYQSAPFMVAYGFRQLSMQQLVLAQSLISTTSLVLLCPLNLLYWRGLGLI